MNCGQMRELISYYLDDETTPIESESLHAHLAECEECRGVLASYKQVGTQIRLIPTLAPSSDIRRRVLNTIAEQNRKQGWFFRVPFGARLAVSAATIVFIAAGLLFVSQQDFLSPGAPADTMVAQSTGTSYNIPADSVVRIRFDRVMDAASVEQSIRVEPNVKVTMSWDDNTLSVVPTDQLELGTVYTITVNQSAKDTSGNNLSGPLTVALRAVEPSSNEGPSGEPTSGPSSTTVLTGTPGGVNSDPQMVAQVTGSINAEVLVDPVTASDPVQVAEQLPTVTPSTAAASSATKSPTSSKTATASAGRTPGRTTPSAVASRTQPAGGPTVAATGPITATGEPGVGSDMTPTPAFGETPTVTATLEPGVAVEVTEGLKTVYSNNAADLADLGSPAAQGVSLDLIVQRFQHGALFQVAGSSVVYSVLADGSWARYDTSLLIGAPAAGATPEANPGTGLIEPEGVFADVWREVAGLREILGWAVEEPEESTGVAQDFEHGQLIDLDGNLVLALYDDGLATVVSGSLEDSSDTLNVPTQSPIDPASPTPDATPEVVPAPTPSETSSANPEGISAPTSDSTPIQ